VLPRRSLFLLPGLACADWIASPDRAFRGWPTLIRRKSGELLAVYSGGREAHVCPYGRVELIRSLDDGQTWSHPQIVWDTPIDDRDAGILETAKGTLLVTTFTSLVYEKQPKYQGFAQALPPKQRETLLDSWMLRSTDGGLTWSAPYRVPVNSPHGPIALSNGQLAYPGKVLYGGKGEIGVSFSNDDGLSWKRFSPMPTRPGDNAHDYHELHGVEAKPGHLIVHIRNHNKANERETLQTESADGGKTWSTPHAIGVWGLPSHLLRLRDGRLVMTYSHRREPRGNQARISADLGKTWSEPITLSGDGSGDLGYPSTVELTNGEVLSLWYEVPKPGEPAALRTKRWAATPR
jgi:sialidase-1